MFSSEEKEKIRGLLKEYQHGNRETGLLELLIRNGISVDLDDPRELFLLLRGIFSAGDDIEDSIALVRACERFIGELTEAIADVNRIDSEGQTALMRAINLEKTSLALSLIRQGANLDLQDKRGNSALMYAIIKRNTAVALELVKKCVNVNCRDANGNSALMFAVQGGHDDVVERLLDRGADATLTNKQGDSALDIVRRKIAKCEQEKERERAILYRIRTLLTNAINPRNYRPREPVKFNQLFPEEQSPRAVREVATGPKLK